MVFETYTPSSPSAPLPAKAFVQMDAHSAPVLAFAII